MSEARTVVSKGRVGRQVDVLLLAVCDQVILQKQRMCFGLIDGWDNAGCFDELLQDCDRKIGDSNCTNFALGSHKTMATLDQIIHTFGSAFIAFQVSARVTPRSMSTQPELLSSDG